MSVEIAWKQNNLVTDFHLLKLLQVACGLGLQTFVCDFSRQNICSAVQQSPQQVLRAYCSNLYMYFGSAGYEVPNKISYIVIRKRFWNNYMYSQSFMSWKNTRLTKMGTFQQILEAVRILTHSIWQIQLWCPRSKWNMGQILAFLNLYFWSKFSYKNDMVSAWRNFKNIFPRPLFTIIFRSEMLKFHPYSIFTGDTRVEFAIYCVLSCIGTIKHLWVDLFKLLPITNIDIGLVYVS